jgi:hypothetical protein
LPESTSRNLRESGRRQGFFRLEKENTLNVKFGSSQLQSMELKYCERCGNIWLRQSGSARTQCAPCTRAEAAILDGPVSFLRLWTRLRAEVQA